MPGSSPQGGSGRKIKKLPESPEFRGKSQMQILLILVKRL